MNTELIQSPENETEQSPPLPPRKKTNEELFYDAMEALSRLKAGDTFKNYRQLCESTGIPVLTSDAKEAQMRRLNDLFALSFEGQRITVTKDFNLHEFHQIASGLAYAQTHVKDICYTLYNIAVEQARNLKPEWEWSESNWYFKLDLRTLCEVTQYLSFETVYQRQYEDYAEHLFGERPETMVMTEPEYRKAEPYSASQATHFIWYDVRARLIEDFRTLRESILKELKKSRFIVVENHVETYTGRITELDYIPCTGLAILSERDAARWKAAMGKTMTDTGFLSRRQAKRRSYKAYQTWIEAHKKRLAEQDLPEAAMFGDDEPYLVITPGALKWDIPKRLLPPDWSKRWEKVKNHPKIRGRLLAGQGSIDKAIGWFTQGL